MNYNSQAIEKAVDYFASLPSIGRKTALRLTYFLLRQENGFLEEFSKGIYNLKDVQLCATCFNYTEADPCNICASHKRDRTTICVVESPSDVIAIEKTHDFFGLYHILHGVIDPFNGISPNDLKIKELIQRIEGVNEIILAINPSVEGEVTMQYIAKFIKPLGVKVSRIASGIPIGSSLEFSDEATLSRAIEGRITL